MNLDVIPDLTMRGQDDPHGRAPAGCAPTVGQLATCLRSLAGRPGDWWHLVAFEAAEPVRRRLTGVGSIDVGLVVWPPGHRTGVRDHGGTEVTMVIAGELAEVTVEAGGVTERPLRANRPRVHGAAHARRLANPGPGYAVTLHARPSRAAGGSAA